MRIPIYLIMSFESNRYSCEKEKSDIFLSKNVGLYLMYTIDIFYFLIWGINIVEMTF